VSYPLIQRKGALAYYKSPHGEELVLGKRLCHDGLN
jgi:hypothetical protein